MKHFLLLLLIFGFSQKLAAQGPGFWGGVGIEKKFNKKFSAGINTQFRFADSFSFLQTNLIDAGTSYKLHKNFEVSANYRYITRRKSELKNFKTRHRFYVDAAYSKKFKRVKFENRVRYQHQFQDNDGELAFDASYLRNKLEVSIPNKTKFTPYFSSDLFYRIGSVFDQIRPKIGIDFKLNKHNSIDAGVLSNISLINTETFIPIINIDYKFKF